MKRINVFSRQGEDRNEDLSFRSIVELYKKGYISQKDIVSADDEHIKTSLYEFVRSSVKNDKQEEGKNVIHSEGASWFANFRGVNNADENAAWQKFVEKIADYFHRQYSFLEYAAVDNSKLEKERSLQKQRIRNVLAFFIEDKNISIEDDEEGSFVDDIYGATIKLNISDGSGEAKPVIGKIIFRNKDDGRGLEPINKNIFEDIQASLGSFNSQTLEEENENKTEGSKSEIVISILNALDDVLNREEGFQDIINFEEKRDRDAIENMVSRGPNHIVELECRYAEVLSVFHLNWVTSSYNVLQEGTPIFNVNFGIGDRLSLKCLVCNDPQKLIFNNKILIGETASEAVEYTINSESNTLGFSAQEIEKIKAESPFKKHAFDITCKHARFETSCRKFACDNKIFKLKKTDEKGNTAYKTLCIDCPYPEIVYHYDGRLFYTPTLVHCRDTLSLRPTSDTGICKVCGRTFASLSETKLGTCDFCKEGLSSSNNVKSNKLFNKYSVMLPLRLRLKNPSKKNKCIEDEELIIFNISGKIYLQKKADLLQKGYLPSPALLKSKIDKEKK